MADETRTWSCLCGNFEGKVTGDPKLAVWCHCGQCRKMVGSAMQLGVWDDDKISTTSKGGDDALIKYESKPGVFRNSCGTCGAFVVKTAGPGFNVVPLGALSGTVVKPTCHIFVADKGNQSCFEGVADLPQHDEFP